MTVRWTYGDNPLTSPADEVRFLVGDTNSTDPLLSDGEVAYVLSKAGNSTALAALYAAEALWLKFSYMVDQSVGAVSISFSQRMGNLEKVLANLRMRVALLEGVPYGGGISKADVANNNTNGDRVQPRFYRGILAPTGTVEDYGGGETFVDPLLGGQA